MPKPNALIPVDQKNVDFYGDEVTAVRLANGGIFVPVRPLVEALGLAWSSQLQRIRRDPVLKTELVSVFVINTESQRGGRDVQCLPLDYVSGFLFGINADRVRDDLRERVIRYQRECYKILAEAFQEGRLTADPSFDEILKSASTDTLEAYQIAMALVKLARNQIMIEARLDSNDVQLTDHEQRLEEIESTLGDPGRHVTPDQASQISQAVKTVAITLGKQTKKNEFGAVYGELYRKYGVTSYKQIPASRFQTCMDWLSQWHDDLTGDAPF
jgi:hypothetical protein